MISISEMHRLADEKAKKDSMHRQKTGGPAFSCDDSYGECKGITIRDYFAAQAMVAIFNERCLLSDGLTFEQAVATKSYEMADAMMSQRSKVIE